MHCTLVAVLVVAPVNSGGYFRKFLNQSTGFL